MTVKLKFKELQIMYTQIKRTNGGEKNNTARSFTFPHKGENQHTRNHTHPRYKGNFMSFSPNPHVIGVVIRLILQLFI